MKAYFSPLILLAAIHPFACLSDEAATKGLAVMETNQHAVISVRLTLKTVWIKDGQSSPAGETRYNLTGTVLDPSGLTVLAYSATDAAQFHKRINPSYADYKVDSEITGLKLVLDDNTELPAEIVLRDRELDLAFVRPKSPPAQPLSAVDFTRCGSAKALEQVIVLNRLNQISGLACSASIPRITAVIKKPRPFYLLDGNDSGTLGSPVFSLNGDILGVLVMRVGSAMEDDYRQNFASVIMPATEVAKVAKQVPSMQKPAVEGVKTNTIEAGK